MKEKNRQNLNKKADEYEKRLPAKARESLMRKLLNAAQKPPKDKK